MFSTTHQGIYCKENLSILISEFKKEFGRKCETRDETEADDLFLKVFNEVRKGISEGVVDSLICYTRLIEWMKGAKRKDNLNNYFDELSLGVRNSSLLITACKYDRLGIVERMFGDGNNDVCNLSTHLVNESSSPGAVDEEGHSCFYYAIRSDNVNLVETLVDKWPGDYFTSHSEELDDILSKAYKELMLKRVPLSNEMNFFVQDKLIGLRFFSNDSGESEYVKISLGNVKLRIGLITKHVNILNDGYNGDLQVDSKFLSTIKFIASNIHVLKQQLKCTYGKVPWEEMEFCLVAFVSLHVKQREINVYFRSVLNKGKILSHLLCFSKCLKDVMCEIESADAKALWKPVQSQRKTVIANIIGNYSAFRELYDDYEKIRDVYSLEKMRSYIELAVSADCSNKEGQLIVTRALQVIGEHLKNTLESPKLSSAMSKLLLYSIPPVTREIITSLRNSLSHSESLGKRKEIEDKTDGKLFKNIQNDIKRIGSEIMTVLHKNKINIIQKCLLNFSESTEECKMIEVTKSVILKSFFNESGNISKVDGIVELIEKFRSLLIEKTFYEEELFKEIDEIIAYENKLPSSEGDDNLGLFSFLSLCEKCRDNNPVNLNVLRVSKHRAKTVSNNLERIATKVDDNRSTELLGLCKKVFDSAKLRMNGDKIDELCLLLVKIVHTCKVEMNNISWIEEFGEELRNNKEESFKNLQTKQDLNDMITKKYTTLLEQKLSLLKTILNFNEQKGKTVDEVSSILNNEELKVASEMILLDIMSILESSKKCVSNNQLFLNTCFPLLIGKGLRNHLAHCNPLMEVLFLDPAVAIISNSKKLILGNIHAGNMMIGKLAIDDPLNAEENLNEECEVTANQERLFAALKEGNYEESMICIKKGADVWARSSNLWTSSHFAAMSPSVDTIKFILDNNCNANVKDREGKSPLHVAASFGRKDNVEFLIRVIGMDVNERDIFRKTPLHYAAQNGHEDVVKVLLKLKAGTNNKDSYGYSPVHYAVVNNHEKAAIFLLQKEKNVDSNQIMGGCTSLYIAAENGLMGLVNYLLQNKADPNARTDRQGIPLHSAALNGHLEVVEALVSRGADVNARICNGCTPLHCTVENGHEDTVEVLLAHGANVNIADKVSHYTPLHFASKYGYERIVKDLLKCKANVNAKTHAGLTPLIMAAEHGHEKIVRLLLKHGALVNTSDNSGQTALHKSSYNGKENIVRHLIQERPNLNARDKMGNTALHLASWNVYKEIVDILISEGVNVNVKNLEGLTPLHLSAFGGHKDISVILINNGVYVDERDVLGRTPLHVAVANKSSIRIIECLLSKGADVNAKNLMDVTVLGVAIISGNLNAVEALLDSGANANLLCNSASPLCLAVMGNHSNIVDILISKGADVNGPSKEGVTPLRHAVNQNNKDIAKILISKGADVNAGDLYSAVTAGSKRIVDLLLKHDSINMNVLSDVPGNVKLLHLAAMKGRAGISKALLAKGLYVDVMGEDNTTPLYIAVFKGYKEVAEIFLENGANVNHETVNGTPLYVAASEGYNDVVEVLLDYGADVNILDSKNRSPIEMSVAHGHFEVVETLLRQKDSNLHRKGNDNYTLLHIAAQEGNLDIVKLLFDKGLDVNLINSDGSKPIHIAAENGNKEIVEFFLNHGNNVNDLNASLWTLLHYAAYGGHVEVGKFLVELNVDVDALDEHKRTPVHTAALEGNIDFLLFLLSKGATYNSKDVYKKKPLDLAGSPDVMKILSSTDKLFAAVKENNPSGVETCLKEGAFIDAKSADNSMALHHAACKGYENVVDILLKNKANPNVIAKNGYSPLHFASKFGHFGIVKALLSKGAIYNASSANGKTPLQFAMNKDIVNLLELVENSFKGVKNGCPNVVNNLSKIKDVDEVKAVVNCCSRDGKSLTVTAMHYDYPHMKRLNEILQDDVSDELRLANILVFQGRYEESLKVLKNALKKREDILGSDSPGTLDIEFDIAKSLYLQNKYQEALCKSREIYEKQKSMLGAEKKNTLSARSFIASILYELGRDEEALSIYEEVYPIQKKVLGESDWDTLETEFHMAVLLDRLGRYEEVLKRNKDVFEKRKSLFGPLDKQTLAAQNNIAVVLFNMDKNEEALKIYQEVYEGKKRVFGPNHSFTMMTLQDIATVLFKQRRLDESLKAFEEVYDLQKKVLGQNHIDTLYSQLGIGNVLFAQGKFLGALKAYKDGLEQRKLVLGPNHPEILGTLKKIEIINHGLKFQGSTESEALQLLQNDIHAAANDGDEKVVEGLIKNGANPNARNKEGKTPLHFAVYGNHKNVVKVLLRNGADFMMVTRKGNSVLHTAISKGYIEMVDLLLQRVKLSNAGKLYEFVNAKTIASGSTALHIAAKNGCLDLVKIVLEYGAAYDAVDYISKKTALDYSEDQDIESLLKLIEKVFDCARNGNSYIISELKRLKSEYFSAVLNARNRNGKTALQIASVNKRRDIAEILISLSRKN